MLRDSGKGVIALLNALAVVERLQGNWAAAQTWHERSLAAAREAGDRAAAAAVLSNLADVVSAQGDEVAARRLFEQALAEFRDLGDHRGIAWSLNHLGDVARASGHNAEARRRYEEAAQAFRARGDPWGTARTWNGCIQERQTTPATAFSFVSLLTGITPSSATDMDIDTAPTGDDATKWEPLWGYATYMRRSTTASLTGNTSSLGSSTACPHDAATFAELDEEDFDDYVDRFSLLGCVGSEDWQLKPFVSGPRSLLETNGATAKQWREWFGLRLPADDA